MASSNAGAPFVRDRVRTTLVHASNARVPRAFFVHCDTFRAITAGRSARSARLFVGSTDGSSRNRTSDPASEQRPRPSSSRWLSGSFSGRSRRCAVIAAFSRRARPA